MRNTKRATKYEFIYAESNLNFKIMWQNQYRYKECKINSVEKHRSQNERYLQLKVHSFLGPESVGNVREKQLKTDLEEDKCRGKKGESRTVKIVQCQDLI